MWVIVYEKDVQNIKNWAGAEPNWKNNESLQPPYHLEKQLCVGDS